MSGFGLISFREKGSLVICGSVCIAMDGCGTLSTVLTFAFRFIEARRRSFLFPSSYLFAVETAFVSASTQASAYIDTTEGLSLSIRRSRRPIHIFFVILRKGKQTHSCGLRAHDTSYSPPSQGSQCEKVNSRQIA